MQLEEITGAGYRRPEARRPVIVQRLASDIVLVNQVAQYIIGAGGKRLRPLSVVLAAKACGHPGEKHVAAAAIIEFIHTATLLHDDVVDGSDLRRGRGTANHVFGNEASVLVGDFLYSRSFQMMVELGDMRIQEVMANATNTIAGGEVLQLMNAHDPDTTEQSYLEVIYRKTAKLFEAGAQMAAIVSNAAPAKWNRPSSITAGTWAPRSNSSTMHSITRPASMKWARTWATTSPKASQPCR